jgi:hypothetical protein
MHRRRQGDLQQGRHLRHEGGRRLGVRAGHQGVLAIIALSGTLLLGAGCPNGANSAQLRPELGAAAEKRDAIGVSDALEDLIDTEADTPEDREAALDAVKKWPQGTAEYAYARAALIGRVAESKGAGGAMLLKDMEQWAKRSIELDASFRDGAATRMLGSLYVLAPAQYLKDGNSEKGLELLEAQVKKFPDPPENHLRLAEGYLALDDADNAVPALCKAIAGKPKLRPSELRLLDKLVEQAGGVPDCSASAGE